ncbi:DUF4381 family protein [Seongchinamella sediminis]|uniref:DUF4381 family protein n=1 Tax=Seongchinamella sediminis TaxID=2283635 RepID=A0A3L7DZ49_9GAMM|nr:DUF4381 domain-containing protein [Seongchinamella sediminis]RLQ21820.1 DUF4381 family protein [Seongchinamella sediminis]
MSLPALPEIFGNYALGEFNEVVSPPPVDWWPQTPGWHLVAALLLLWLLRRGARKLRYWYHNRYRREALARLQDLAPTPGLVAEVNRTLKLSALAGFPRQEVAALWGEPWVEFLNARCAEPPFSAAQCRLLAMGVYQQRPMDPATAAALLQASLNWVKQHRNHYDG